MASLEAAIVARAAAHSGLFARIGLRIYPNTPEPEKPTEDYLVYQIKHGKRQRTFGKRAQIVEATLHLHCYSATKHGCVLLKAETVKAFDMWWDSTATPSIEFSALNDEEDATVLLDEQTQRRRYSLEFIVKYRNPEYV
jgi:hypothetical protein